MYNPGLASIGAADTSSFWGYWERMKGMISQLYQLGPNISMLRARAGALKTRAQRAESPGLASEADLRTGKIDSMFISWQGIRNRLNKWLPSFRKIEESATPSVPVYPSKIRLPIEQPATELGLLPFILPAWAIASLIGGGLAAAAYITTHGLSLLKEYKIQKSVLDQLERKVISAETAKGILSPPMGGGIIQQITDMLGKAGTVVVAGTAAFLAYRFTQ